METKDVVAEHQEVESEDEGITESEDDGEDATALVADMTGASTERADTARTERKRQSGGTSKTSGGTRRLGPGARDKSEVKLVMQARRRPEETSVTCNLSLSDHDTLHSPLYQLAQIQATLYHDLTKFRGYTSKTWPALKVHEFMECHRAAAEDASTTSDALNAIRAQLSGHVFEPSARSRAAVQNRPLHVIWCLTPMPGKTVLRDILAAYPPNVHILLMLRGTPSNEFRKELRELAAQSTDETQYIEWFVENELRLNTTVVPHYTSEYTLLDSEADRKKFLDYYQCTLEQLPRQVDDNIIARRHGWKAGDLLIRRPLVWGPLLVRVVPGNLRVA